MIGWRKWLEQYTTPYAQGNDFLFRNSNTLSNKLLIRPYFEVLKDVVTVTKYLPRLLRNDCPDNVLITCCVFISLPCPHLQSVNQIRN